MITNTIQKKESLFETFNSFLRDFESICKGKALRRKYAIAPLPNMEDVLIEDIITSWCGICTSRIWLILGQLEKRLRNLGVTVLSCRDSSTRLITKLFTIQANISVKIVLCPKDVSNRLYAVQIEMVESVPPTSIKWQNLSDELLTRSQSFLTALMDKSNPSS